MLVAQWDAVHPWPHGAVGGPYEYFYQYLIDYYGDVFDVSMHGYCHLQCMLRHLNTCTIFITYSLQL